MGFHISFSGIVTFRNASELREVARQVPLDRLLVENGRTISGARGHAREA